MAWHACFSGDGGMSTLAKHTNSWNLQQLAAEQPRLELPVWNAFTRVFQACITVQIMPPRPSPPTKLGRTPTRVNALAFGPSLC
jgi:hypothetical protein